jgi:hypothetical protein
MASERGRSGEVRFVGPGWRAWRGAGPRGVCDQVIWRGWPGSVRVWRLRGGFYPPFVASCRPIGLRFTSAAAQLACSVALSLPMYRLLRAP